MGALHRGRGHQNLLLDEGGVGEIGVLLALDGGEDEFPVAVTLGGIGQRAVVTAPRYPVLGGGGVGDALCGIVFYRGHKDLTANDKGHHLAVRRNGGISSATGVRHALNLVAVVVPEVDVHLAGLSALAHGIEFAILGEAQSTLVVNREETHGINREIGHSRELAGIVDGHRIHVHRAAVALAQEINGLPVGAEDGVAVLATDVGQVGVMSRLGIIAPDVAGDG